MTIRSSSSMHSFLNKGFVPFVLISLLSLTFALHGCGEDENEASADETEKVESKSSASKSADDKKKKAAEAKEKRKKERDDKRRELAEKRRKKAKVSAEARKKAINTAAQAQSGRETSKPTTETAPSKAKPVASKRVLRQPEAPKDFVPLNIERILPVSDVKELTGEKRLTSLGPLPGIAQSETYNSRYMAPPKRSTYGSSVQVWKETLMRDMNERYSRMRRDYPNVTDTNAITPKGFFSYWNDFMTLVFMDFQKKLLVAVSCGTKICTPEELYKLAQKAKKQL